MGPNLNYLLSVIRWLSLDVVVGGIVFTKAIGRIAQIDLHWSIPAALACCIWLIYTLDHLIDANTLSQSPSMERHLFHKKFRKPIFLLFAIVVLIGLRLLFYLPYEVLIYGCVLLGLVGLYFLSIWLFKVYFAKEVFIAVLYSFGIFLGVFSANIKLDVFVYFLFIQTILMALSNLLLFSYYEEGHDRQDGHLSWATHFGAARTKKLLRWVFLLMGFFIIGTCFICQSREQFYYQIIFAVMAVLLGLIYRLPHWFGEKERFRWVGDAVFMLPGLILIH